MIPDLDDTIQKFQDYSNQKATLSDNDVNSKSKSALQILTMTNLLTALCKQCKKEFPHTLGPSGTPYYVFCKDCSFAYRKSKPSDADVKKVEDVLTKAKTVDNKWVQSPLLSNNIITKADIAQMIEDSRVAPTFPTFGNGNY